MYEESIAAVEHPSLRSRRAWREKWLFRSDVDCATLLMERHGKPSGCEAETREDKAYARSNRARRGKDIVDVLSVVAADIHQ